MPIMPMWPNLQPRATDPLWFNADRPCDDESDVLALEAEHEAWKEQMRGVGCEQIPIGKSASDFRGSEEEEEEEEEEEGEGEEEEESDTHEEEEEEFDDMDMEVSYSHQQQRSSPTDTVTDPVSIRMQTNFPAQSPLTSRRRAPDPPEVLPEEPSRLETALFP